ncbi:uncharacterized protein [Periplaneta americana]|uniref:uncharacterized protein isoform X2 n=1 Tax=Periplaneta americana TaxID=6978 RepID=UPI0037E91AD1
MDIGRLSAQMSYNARDYEGNFRTFNLSIYRLQVLPLTRVTADIQDHTSKADIKITMLRKTVEITLLAALVFQLQSNIRADEKAPDLPDLKAVLGNLTEALPMVGKVVEGANDLTFSFKELQDITEEVQKKQRDGILQECDLYRYNYLLLNFIQKIQNQLNTMSYPTLSNIDNLIFKFRSILNPQKPYYGPMFK